MNRMPFFDNVRLILIFLVVFGHMIQPFAVDSQLINSIYVFIYIFHMPMFIMLAGFFAKGIGQPKYILNLAKKLLIPYLIFQGLYTVLYYLMGQEDWYSGVTHPQWAMWFLISLFSWHILLVLFKKIPTILSVGIAVFIGIAVGYTDLFGYGLSMSRTLVFFPFFLAGYFMTKEHVKAIKTSGLKIAGLVFMAALFTFIYLYINVDVTLDTDWLSGAVAYRKLEAEISGGLMRLVIYILAALLIVSMIALIPSGDFGWLTKIGEKTLYVYLLHGFIIQPLRVYEVLSYNGWLDIFIFLLLTAVIVIVFSSRTAVNLTRPLIELKWKE